MAAQFTNITLEDLDAFLKKAFRALRPRQAVCKSEYCYLLSFSPNVRIQILTAITRGNTESREVGSDTVKLQLVGGPSNRPLLAGKGSALTMKRTQGWKNTLQNRIEDLVELYEDRQEYWESRATGEAPPKSDPPVQEDDRHLDLDDREPERPVETGPLYGTFAKLRNGDWGVKITGRGAPGAKALITTQGGQKRTVVLKVLQWKGADNYGRGEVEIWSIEDNRSKTAEEPAPSKYSYDFRGVDDDT